MAFVLDPKIEHLLRRTGFGARQDELDLFRAATFGGAVTRLLEYERIPDDVDAKIGAAGYVGVTTRGQFAPASVITDARQRWLFRLVHTERPLQEKMTLFWHNHFATGYAKIAGIVGAAEATRYMAAKPSEDPAQVRGQIELFRALALGNFKELLIAVAKDTAMLFWLDGYTNTRARPQENFGREIMELFTMGVGHYTEPDVYAAARVFTGWNLSRPGSAADNSQRYQFVYLPNQHDTAEKTFSFPIYPDGGKTIRARAAADGMQDGLDLIEALAANPETPRYLGRKLYRFFVSESGDIPGPFLDRIADAYFRSGYSIKAVMRELLTSREFADEAHIFTRFGWPVEFVVRALKDIGWNGFSVNDALTPLSNMGQNLFDPPDVAGWDLGRSWFSTGSMLARMNFASQLAANQKFNLAAAGKGSADSPEALLAFVLDALKTPSFDNEVTAALLGYLRGTGAWTGSTAQLQSKVPGLIHLVAGTPEYQFV
ncbi:MAG TPA: DUF1800 domain-containing protein [Vicinamibacterales bacterium]|nr:DUF1800 domain-containing protein [Vicinamibacterales bacterium]